MAANKIKSIKLKVYYVLSNQAEAFFSFPSQCSEKIFDRAAGKSGADSPLLEISLAFQKSIERHQLTPAEGLSPDVWE